ncbi:amino acid-binding protein [Desulfocarbo indianensis]|nr:amino acid-binding protein [Desulfocarbo indianensis]
MPGHELKLLPQEMAVCRLPPAGEPPGWALRAAFLCLTRTDDELSVICPQTEVPPGVEAAGGWRCLKVRGPLEFNQVGVLASLAQPLAQAGVSILAVSTYETDYLLVPAQDLDAAVSVLRKHGHAVDL